MWTVSGYYCTDACIGWNAWSIQQLTYKQFRRLRIRTFKFAVYSTNAHGATCTVLRTHTHTHTMYKQVPTWNNTTTTTNTSMLQFRFSVTCYKPIKCYHNPKRKHMTLHTITNRMMDCKRILTQVKRPFYKYLKHTHTHTISSRTRTNRQKNTTKVAVKIERKTLRRAWAWVRVSE